jgi:hypothetical protein
MSTGFCSAGASTARGDDGDRHPDATLTATHAGAPAATGVGAGDDAGTEAETDGVGFSEGLGVEVASGAAPHAASSVAAMSAYAPRTTELITQPSVCNATAGA